MAAISENNSDTICFVNTGNGGDTKNAPTLVVQAGDWELENHVETGFVFDVSGEHAPILTANDVRKLAKWLTRVADSLDGVKHSDKKGKTRRHYEEEDDAEDYTR